MSLKINIYNSNAFKVDKNYVTNASTWGELRQELSSKNILQTNMVAMIKETKEQLNDDSYVLPRGKRVNEPQNADIDFTLFLIPSKNKAGHDK